MEYDGFRQMVLGANIKPMKKGQVLQMYNSQPQLGNVNSTASYAQANNFQDEMGYDEEFVARVLELKAEEQVAPPESLEVFEKFLSKKLKEPMQRYVYMRLFDIDDLQPIFKAEFDPEVLLLITDVFTKQVIKNVEFNNLEEQKYICKFMLNISQSPKFDFTLDFMGDDEREQIRYVIENLDKIEPEGTDEDKGLLKSLQEAFQSL